MDEVNWFLLMALLSLFGWQVGTRWGRRSAVAARVAVLGAVCLLVLLTYLVKHPSVAVQVLPVGVLARVEGVVAVPVFLVILGVAWERSTLRRQRVMVGWGFLLGAIYFVNGGLWMLQSTPTETLASDVSGGEVMQSQDYSCVPAAAATCLRRLGLEASEAEMAELTRTRPGRGSTTVRALHGLNLKLASADSPWRAQLVEVAAADVRGLPTPVMTPLRYEATRRHMVTIVGFTHHGVRVIDPMDGWLVIRDEDFVELFTGEVIVFLAGT